MTVQGVPGIPTAAVSRLVTYLRILEELERAEVPTTSSGALAERAQVSAFQVRKDLAYFGRFGTRGMGYTVSVLKRELTRVLGLNRSWSVVIVGMGRLGQAIAHYPGASEYQFGYVGLFDVKAELIGMPVDVPAQREGVSGSELAASAQPRQLNIQHIRDLAAFAQQQAAQGRAIDMGFLAVPPEHAQAAAQSMVEAGVKGILNFAPTLIQPAQDGAGHERGLQEISDEWRDVMVENVDFLVGMKRLAFYMLNPQLRDQDPEEKA
ncbi:redox-sensing transcriptional repressor Rex [Deinococcus detaillensis]|uniref:Redox-sensing transcriptional repressor Rex n=1 Tax=Deinococcus detaillensis TaxID=2592048 RepID=A0A553UKV6_9DEIO|nr:redox-sensing transcriptional repressor Rex [Deinococcus detaillensis]TSA80830.1 redox-sensing transcriptional repressor Rex [Deinococcus detaillensis]